MFYFLPYALNLIGLGLLAIFYQQVEDKKKKMITLFCFIYVLLFFGFRGYIWDDWQVYYQIFKDISWYDFQINPFKGGNDHFYEPGYVLMNLFIKSIYDNYVFFQFTQTSICALLLFRFIMKKELNTPFFLMLFLAFGGYEILINLMRNSIAILIFLNAIPYLEERKPVHYFMLCLLAVTFHLTSILFLPLYFILNVKINKWVFLGVFLAGLAFFILHISLLTPLISLVLGGSDSRMEIMAEQYSKIDEAKTLSIGLLERMLTGTLMFCYYDKLQEKSEKEHIYINAVMLYFACVFFLNELAVVSQRLGMLLMFGYWIVWYQLLTIFHYRNNRILFGIFICLYCFLKKIGMCNYQRCSYDNHIWGADTYQERRRLWGKNQ